METAQDTLADLNQQLAEAEEAERGTWYEWEWRSRAYAFEKRKLDDATAAFEKFKADFQAACDAQSAAFQRKNDLQRQIHLRKLAAREGVSP